MPVRLVEFWPNESIELLRVSGTESLYHRIAAGGFASAMHFMLIKLAESSNADVNKRGLVSVCTSGESGN